MKITVELDDGTVVNFRAVTDAYLAVRQLEPMGEVKSGEPALLPETRSYSWGSKASMRELVKELHQSEIEMQELLKRAGP